MALTVTLSQVAGVVLGNKKAAFMVSITNTSASSVSLTSLQVMELTESDAIIEQPSFMAPNQPVGVGNVVLTAGGTYNAVFNVVFPGLQLTGTSPQAPGGANPTAVASSPDANFTLGAIAQASDGSVGSAAPLAVVILAPDSNFPPPAGGALWLGQGQNFVNLLLL